VSGVEWDHDRWRRGATFNSSGMGTSEKGKKASRLGSKQEAETASTFWAMLTSTRSRLD